MTFLKSALTLFGVALALTGYSQIDSTHKATPPKKNVKVPNTTKLELVYKNATVESYNSRGYVSSYNLSLPYLRVNDAKPIPLNRSASQLRKYYTRAPLANEELNQMNRQRRIGTAEMWAGGAVGFVSIFTGVIAAAGGNADKPKDAYLWGGVGLGTLAMAGGAYLKYVHNRKAQEHLRQSLDTYNDKYYKPLTKDSSVAKAPKPDEPLTPFSKHKNNNYQDSVEGDLLENDPWHSGLWGVNIMPVLPDIDFTNFAVTGAIGAFYTYKSIVGVSAQYQYAYLDDFTGNKDSKPEEGGSARGIPVAYTKSNNFEVNTRFNLFAWEKEKATYNFKLGTERASGHSIDVVADAKFKAVKAITGRLGYILENKIHEDPNGIPYATTTAPYILHYDYDVMTLNPDNIQASAAMLKTNSIAAGVGYTIYKDAKANVTDERYAGRKMVRQQIDMYVDVLYATSMELQDIVYYHDVMGSNEKIPQRLNLAATPMHKLGARVGYQSLFFFKSHFGYKGGIEFAYKPGITMADMSSGLSMKMSWGIVFGGKQ